MDIALFLFLLVGSIISGYRMMEMRRSSMEWVYGTGQGGRISIIIGRMNWVCGWVLRVCMYVFARAVITSRAVFLVASDTQGCLCAGFMGLDLLSHVWFGLGWVVTCGVWVGAYWVDC